MKNRAALKTPRCEADSRAPFETDICIIGGGAAGIAAAIAAIGENPSARVTILEKNETIGKKILATGNGRCNLTNRNCEDVSDVVGFFRALGVLTREEEQGRLYPYSRQAKDVRDALVSCLDARGVEIVTGFAADHLSFSENLFRVRDRGAKRQIRATRLLLATGGKAAPRFGCAGDGYRFAREAGHTVAKIFPALTPVACAGDFEALKGIRVKAAVTLLRKGEPLLTERGELQFTEYGLSGICVFNLSSHIRLNGYAFGDYAIAADLLPDIGAGELARELKSRRSNPHISIDRFLLSLAPGGLAALALDRAEVGQKVEAIGDEQIERIAGVLKNLTFPVSNVKGWQFAQCTAGGVPFGEINEGTMESNLVKGLYFAGEILDYDGPCGGYNLHNAWRTGIRAGKAMAANVQNP